MNPLEQYIAQQEILTIQQNGGLFLAKERLHGCAITKRKTIS